MTPIDILRDFAARPFATVNRFRASLTPDALNAQPGGHDNSIAWLLWHIGREIDAQTADLSGREQLWARESYQQRLGIDDDSIGVGHTPTQARGVVIKDPGVLLEYVEGATVFLDEYVSTLTPADLGEIIDAEWDPPVTRGVRLVSIIDDAAQHAGQVGYALGLITR